MKYDGLLPLGTVVRLRETGKNVMVAGYAMRMQGDGANNLYDYAGVPHPVGQMGPDRTILFNQGNIETVFALGHMDGETIRYLDVAEAELARQRKGEQNG